MNSAYSLVGVVLFIVLTGIIYVAFRYARTFGSDVRNKYDAIEIEIRNRFPGSDFSEESDISEEDDFSEYHGTGHHHGDAVDDEEPPQGNQLIARIKNGKVAAIVSENVLCRIGMHQGIWTTEGRSGCLQRRYCMYCGILQPRMRHTWPSKANGEYFEDGSCETRVTCFRCGKTKSTGIRHEGVSFWNAYCKRCGEYFGGYGD